MSLPSSTPPPDYSPRRYHGGSGSVPPGAYVLSLGTVAALASAAAVTLAFATDNWAHVSVDRRWIETQYAVSDQNITYALQTDARYFDRVQVFI